MTRRIKWVADKCVFLKLLTWWYTCCLYWLIGTCRHSRVWHFNITAVTNEDNRESLHTISWEKLKLVVVIKFTKFKLLKTFVRDFCELLETQATETTWIESVSEENSSGNDCYWSEEDPLELIYWVIKSINIHKLWIFFFRQSLLGKKNWNKMFLQYNTKATS